MSSLAAFQAVRTIGSVLPSEALSRAVDLRMPGQTAQDYQLTPGMAINAAVARAWDAALGAHRVWRNSLERLPETDPATAMTRDKWLLPLLYELGYGRPQVLPAGIDLPPGLGETQPVHYPISHQLTWPDAGPNAQVGVAVHLVGAAVALDSPTPGVTARAPQSMVQDFLNRSRPYLWAIVSNGHNLRLLRDASSLTKQSYVEFDLDDIFDNQRYAEFRLFFLTVHASRLAPIAAPVVTVAPPDSDDVAPPDTDDVAPPDTDDEPAAESADSLTPESCWLEQWRTAAIADGTRALDALRGGVAVALNHLGTGFVSHPGNNHLRAMLMASPDADKDLHRALLRIAYRLIVLFVAEDRNLLHTASNDIVAKGIYREYFSTRRLRHLATTRTGTRHTDLWDAHLIVTDALGGDGLPTLALPGLAATLFERDTLGVLASAALPNRYLLAAIRALAQITDTKTGTERPVDYRNLDSEELGGVYEGLLAYTPRYDLAAQTFSLDIAAGNERKRSGSYYTPSSLIALVLDEALDPLIKAALKTRNPEAALLATTVLDPAVGSGHFVVAASRRIASALAAVRTGDSEPGPDAIRAAIADVIEHCIYGVDLNDLAIEIAKVALWLEAFDGTRPFPFLDAHLKVGNSILGTTPALLKRSIPDLAFKSLGDDDKKWTAALKVRNRQERGRSAAQMQLFGSNLLQVSIASINEQARRLENAPVASLADLRARADGWRRLDDDPGLREKRLAADAWSAAFIQPKTPGHGTAITHDVLLRIVEDPGSAPADVLTVVRTLAQQYRFFHWHLEFPGIFIVDESAVDTSPNGWIGGFSCVIGNPPWDALQMEDKQFFSSAGRPDIASAKTASLRSRMIESLETDDPLLFEAYKRAERNSEAINHLVRGGRYPLTAHGKINTYSVFAETFRAVTAADGIAGVITPTGLATDKFTAPFIADVLESSQLIGFYDFENEAKIFPKVHHAQRFAVSIIGGAEREVVRTKFAFLTRRITEVPDRIFELAPSEVLMLNPSTGTLPMFRTRRDADITLGVYRRHPVLGTDGGDNPWRLTFSQGLFNMSTDSDRFRQFGDLAHQDFDGWSYTEGDLDYIPLYESKLVWHFDHRFSTYRGATQAQLNMQTLPRVPDSEHDDPNSEPLVRHWVTTADMKEQLADKWSRGWLLGWRDVTGVEKVRTVVPSVIPTTGVGHGLSLAFLADPTIAPLLHATWSSLAFDYIARQKISGTHLTFSVMNQLACPVPQVFESPTPWLTNVSLSAWVTPYVLELSYTSWRLQPYAQEMGDGGAPFRWLPERRALLRGDLDAAMFHIFGLSREDVEHILESFPIVRKYDERAHGEYLTKRLVLDAYDRMRVAAACGGTGWKPLDPVRAANGPRHV